MFMLLFRAVIGLTKSLVSSLFLQAALQVNFFLLMAEFPWQIQLLCSIKAPVYDPTLARLNSRDPKIASKLFKQMLHYVEDSRCLGPVLPYLLVIWVINATQYLSEVAQVLQQTTEVATSAA